MSRDFAEILSALSDAGADYLIVGAHAMAAHGYPRATGDLDVWVRPTAENAERVWAALQSFGAPLHGLTVEDLSSPDVVFQMGVPPHRIDILTEITDVDFDRAWKNRIISSVLEREVPVIATSDLVQNKKAVGRPQDMVDVARLQRDTTDSEKG